MDNTRVNKVYIISGPAGIGNSTTSIKEIETVYPITVVNLLKDFV